MPAYQSQSLTGTSKFGPNYHHKGTYVYEPQLRGAVMNNEQRGQFVQKAKLDRLAYESAEFLSQGQPDKAAQLIGDLMPASKEHFSTWFRLYATRHFKVTDAAVDKFLAG